MHAAADTDLTASTRAEEFTREAADTGSRGVYAHRSVYARRRY